MGAGSAVERRGKRAAEHGWHVRRAALHTGTSSVHAGAVVRRRAHGQEPAGAARALAHQREPEVTVARTAGLGRLEADAVVLDLERQPPAPPRAAAPRTCSGCACRAELASASVRTRTTTAVVSGDTSTAGPSQLTTSGSPWPRRALTSLTAASTPPSGMCTDRSSSRARTTRRADRHRLAQPLGAGAGELRAAGSDSSSASSRVASARSCARPSWISAASRARSRSISAPWSCWRRRAVAIPGGEQVAEQGQQRRGGRVERQRRRGGGHHHPDEPALRDERHDEPGPAGGSNGFATSQLASSRKTSGAPLIVASCQASSSKAISSRARTRRAVPGRA